MMTQKKKELKIQNIAKLYIHSITKTKQRTFKRKYNEISSFLSAVEIAYSSLSAPLQRIINNDFFYQDYPGWWKLTYKKNNYQKLKATAVSKFLELFYEI